MLEQSVQPKRNSIDREWRHTLGLLLLVAVISALPRLFDLGRRGFWCDEIFTIQDSRRLVSSFKGFKYMVASGRPMHYALTAVALSFGGQPELTARLPAMFMGVCGVLAIFFLARHFVGNPGAIVCGLMLALLPYHVSLSQEARMSAGAFLFSTLATLGLVCALRTGNTRYWLLFAGAHLLALYNNSLQSLAVIAAQIVFGFLLITFRFQSCLREAVSVKYKARQAVLHLVFASLAAFVLWLPSGYFTLRNITVDMLAPKAEAPPAGEAPNPDAAARNEPPVSFEQSLWLQVPMLYGGGGLPLFALVCGFCVVGAVWSARNRCELLLLLVCEVVIAVGAISAVGWNHALYARYFVFLLAPYLILASVGVLVASRFVAALLHRVANIPNSVGSSAFLGAASLALSALLILQLADYYRGEREPWREVAQLVAREAESGDLVVLYRAWYEPHFRHYLPPMAQDLEIRLQLSPKDIEEQCRERRIWLVVRKYDLPQSLKWRFLPVLDEPSVLDFPPLRLYRSASCAR